MEGHESTGPAPGRIRAPPSCHDAGACDFIFLQSVAPGGFSHLRPGWDAVNETGATDLWRTGKKRAESRSAATEVLREDMPWRWQMLNARSTKELRYGTVGAFSWRPRRSLLREGALSMGQDAVCAVYTDAPGSRGRGASFGDLKCPNKLALKCPWKIVGKSSVVPWSWPGWIVRRPFFSPTTLLAGRRCSRW